MSFPFVGHTKFVVLVQNEGESNLKVNLSAPNPSDNVVLEIPKHQTIKVWIIFLILCHISLISMELSWNI